MATPLMMRPGVHGILRQAMPFCLQSLQRSFVFSERVRRLSCGDWTKLHIVSDGGGLFSGYERSRLEGGFVSRRFSTGATPVNDAGSIDSPLMQSMENKIKESLTAESVSVKDAYGDGRHVS